MADGPTKMMVYSNPAAGREKDYNEWYNNVHIPEVIAYPGMVGAQRFSVDAAVGEFSFKYVAIYEVEAGADALTLWNKLGADAVEGKLTMTDAIAPEMVMHILKPSSAYQKA